MKAILLNSLLVLILISSFQTKTIFMSTNGNDESGDGSIDNPYLSLMKCQNVAANGDIVYIRGGSYTNFNIAYSNSNYNYIHYFNKSGITYEAYESEKVIFDFEFAQKYKINNEIPSKSVTGFMIKEGAENITFQNFDCTRIPTLSLNEILILKIMKFKMEMDLRLEDGENQRKQKIYMGHTAGKIPLFIL